MYSKYSINLLTDIFTTSGKTGEYILEVGNTCIFARHNDTALLSNEQLMTYFPAYIEKSRKYFHVSRTLCNSLESTFLILHLSDNMPDLSTEVLRFSNYVNCQSLLYKDVLESVLIKALHGKEFYAAFHIDTVDSIRLSFIVTTNGNICTIDMYVGDIAQRVHEERMCVINRESL